MRAQFHLLQMFFALDILSSLQSVLLDKQWAWFSFFVVGGGGEKAVHWKWSGETMKHPHVAHPSSLTFS